MKISVVIVCLVIGTFFRLVWPSDMEWKADEKLTYELARKAADEGNWGSVGMNSSQGFSNFGMTSWPFGVFAYVANSPLALTAFVRWLNILTLFGFLWLILKKIPREEQPIWLLGLSLWSLSIMPVVLSRKLWGCCLITPVSFFALWGHLNRGKIAGAFTWGLAGALLPQIQLSAGFYTLGLAIWTFVKRRGEKIRWAWWVMGSAIGVIGMIPWIINRPSSQYKFRYNWIEIFTFKFYSTWFANGWGLNAKYSLGKHFAEEFLQYPSLFGYPTYGVAILHGVLVAVILLSVKRIFSRVNPTFRITSYYVGAAAIAFGGLFTLTAASIYSHYNLVAFSLIFVWVASIIWDRPKLKWSVLVSQGLITLAYLCFIHQNGGAPRGDYGVPYRLQSKVSP